MSFDLSLIAFLDGDIGAGDPDRVQAVLERPGITVNTQAMFGSDFANVETADGGYCEMIGAQKSNYAAIMIALRGGWTRQVSQLIFDLAKAGDLTILDDQKNTAVLVHERQRQHLPAEFQDSNPPPPVVSSAEELERLLQDGYDAWRNLRGRIAKPPQE